MPGPICYGRGGREPTFTDAAVALGYIDPARFLGGEIQLDKEAALAGIKEKIADPLGLELTEAARGVFDVVLARTVSAIREITVEQGLDPREFATLAFGGAGPVFVPLVGREMKVREIIVPQAPSVFSAWGMLMTDLMREYARTMVGLLSDVGIAPLLEAAQEMTKEAHADLERGGFSDADRAIECDVALHYFGQEHSLEIPLRDDDSLETLSKRYDDLHRGRYGHAMTDPVQLVHLRVRGIGRNPRPELKMVPVRESGQAEPVGTRPAYCFAAREIVDFAVHRRDDLCAGDVIDGPAAIEEETTTAIMHSDQVASVDKYGHIIIEMRETS